MRSMLRYDPAVVAVVVALAAYSQVKMTSSAVNGRRSCHSMPGLRRQWSSEPEADHGLHEMAARQSSCLDVSDQLTQGLFVHAYLLAGERHAPHYSQASAWGNNARQLNCRQRRGRCA